MNNYSSKQNRFFTAPGCEAAFSCACVYDMIIMDIAAAMSVLLIIGVLSVLRVIRVYAALIIVIIIMLVIIGKTVRVPLHTF